jgi:hypothetical protein
MFKKHTRLKYSPKAGTNVNDIHNVVVSYLNRSAINAQITQNQDSIVISVTREESHLNLVLEDLGYFDTWSN